MVEVVNDGGDTVGYLSARDCERDGLEIIKETTQRRWLDDPYVSYHAELAYEQGHLTRRKDYSIVQQILLVACLVRRRKAEGEKQVIDLENMMAIINPDMHARWLQHREQERQMQESAVASDIDWRMPKTPQELYEALEEIADQIDADEAAGEFDGWEGGEDFDAIDDYLRSD